MTLAAMHLSSTLNNVHVHMTRATRQQSFLPDTTFVGVPDPVGGGLREVGTLIHILPHLGKMSVLGDGQERERESQCRHMLVSGRFQSMHLVPGTIPNTGARNLSTTVCTSSHRREFHMSSFGACSTKGTTLGPRDCAGRSTGPESARKARHLALRSVTETPNIDDTQSQECCCPCPFAVGGLMEKISETSRE